MLLSKWGMQQAIHLKETTQEVLAILRFKYSPYKYKLEQEGIKK